jgi:hypothetical protein
MRTLTVLLVATVVLLPGCVKVQPWEKEAFTKSHMAFDPDPLEAKFREHVYQSKEGSFGGYGIGGGGCGCN